MCIAKAPKMPAPPPPPQEVKAPDANSTRRRNAGVPPAAATLLTGANGVTSGLNTGGTTLLGG